MLAATNKQPHSWIWASLLAGRKVLRRGVRINIGDGTSTHIWSTPWAPHLPQFLVPHPTLYPPNIDMVANLSITRPWIGIIACSLISSLDL